MLQGKMQPTKCRYQILYTVSKIVKHNFAATEMPKYYAAPNYFQCSMQSLNVNNFKHASFEETRQYRIKRCALL